MSLTTSQNDFDVPTAILASIANLEETSRKVLPYIKPEYFEEPHHKVLFTCINDYITRYNSLPPKEAIALDIRRAPAASDQIIVDAAALCDYVYSEESKKFLGSVKGDWLISRAEGFCKDRALFIAITESLSIIDGNPVRGKKMEKGAIPQLLQDALAVSFDPSVGHDVFEDYAKRFEFYHETTQRVRSGLRDIDKVTKNGFPNKSLSVFVAPTGIGKSTIMVSMATSMYLAGEKVLYITGEMAEEKIAERIDANVLDVNLDSLMAMPKRNYISRMQNIAEKSAGRIIVKEYPTGSASVIHFRALMNELKIKAKFTPTIVFVDYLNIFASSRMKNGDSSYAYIKAIAEELRGFAVEFNLPVVTATQTNRAGVGASDYDLTEVSESMGVTHTADFIAAMISTDSLEQQGQIRLKQLKNRFGALDNPRSFLLGIDRSKMRVYDCDKEYTETEPQQSRRGKSAPESRSEPKEEDVPPWAVRKIEKPDFSKWNL